VNVKWERERETIDENKKCKWKWAVSGMKENTKLIQLHEKLIEHLIKKKVYKHNL